MALDHHTIALVEDDVLALVDCSSGKAIMSITNDAERIVVTLARRFGLAGRRVIYCDSMGLWSELGHDGERFTRYLSLGNTRTLPQALALVRAR